MKEDNSMEEEEVYLMVEYQEKVENMINSKNKHLIDFDQEDEQFYLK